ncbi:MAG: hypothetical protein ACI823_002699 [Chitinophagales bacterium]
MLPFKTRRIALLLPAEYAAIICVVLMLIQVKAMGTAYGELRAILEFYRHSSLSKFVALL